MVKKTIPWQVAVLQPKTKKEQKMLLAQFNRALSFTRMPSDSATARGVRLVLVDGISNAEAARKVGCDPSAISVAVKRINAATHLTQCPTCGHKL